jgi:hypothetical protein
MGFNRIAAAADVSFPYICSQDTAILRQAFDADAAIAALDEGEAVRQYVARVGGPAASAEQRAELAKLIAEDEGTRAAALDAERTRLILNAFFADFPTCGVDRAKFEALPVDALIESCESSARKLRHTAYRESGDESRLGTIADDVIRWRLRMLQPRERAEAKGRLSEQPSGVSTFAHYYAVNRWIVATVLVGADGWRDFATDKKTGRASDATIDAIDEDWIIEIGDFVLDVPNLRKPEKKA